MEWNSQSIKELRLRAGWSCAELARRLAVTTEMVRSWESSDSTPDENSIIELEKMNLQIDKYNADTVSAAACENHMSVQDVDQVFVNDVDAELGEPVESV